jgi:hypothetical protein
MAACGRAGGSAGGDAVDAGGVLAEDGAPYAGIWAQETPACADPEALWTIERMRMAIAPAERFCAFNLVHPGEEGWGSTRWSVNADCLHAGRQTRDILVFSIDEDASEMRVRINDSRPFDLVRCEG